MIANSHFFSMVLYAAFVCIVLALLRRDSRKSRIRYGLTLFLIMIFGSLLFGWVMTLFIP
ncbi:MAG: hypothetical protein KKD56_06505 [Acidobacteria bacterium]|nr:hypothetical protein [Acidobacteriota bacterium]MCG2816866.1 hypothetical protein [Candidatus Aminicenantes bacterium]MBU1338700.1 hypothetical protein [Acidobacteriota bacterium]MBU4203738.1 hypothetical protein [Acidobacteriota bacterium]MBU4253003.1 hypothetical protein [Acidobacteriota bacterium]